MKRRSSNHEQHTEFPRHPRCHPAKEEGDEPEDEGIAPAHRGDDQFPDRPPAQSHQQSAEHQPFCFQRNHHLQGRSHLRQRPSRFVFPLRPPQTPPLKRDTLYHFATLSLQIQPFLKKRRQLLNPRNCRLICQLQGLLHQDFSARPVGVADEVLFIDSVQLGLITPNNVDMYQMMDRHNHILMKMGRKTLYNRPICLRYNQWSSNNILVFLCFGIVVGYH